MLVANVNSVYAIRSIFGRTMWPLRPSVCRQEVAAGNAFPFQGDLERLERIMKAVALTEIEVSQYVAPKKGSLSGSAGQEEC